MVISPHPLYSMLPGKSELDKTSRLFIDRFLVNSQLLIQHIINMRMIEEGKVSKNGDMIDMKISEQTIETGERVVTYMESDSMMHLVTVTFSSDDIQLTFKTEEGPCRVSLMK